MKTVAPEISIVIPVLNEEDYIKKVLFAIQKNSSSGKIKEILVVDGGSTDKTVAEAKSLGARVVISEKGRAKQMNLGARLASGELLYFIHVDTLPPIDFDQEILDAYSNGYNAGCFQMKFDSNNLFLKFFAWCTKINHQICRGGDQSLFISKKLFKKAQGFNESFTIYEDNEFIKRVYKMAPFKVLSKHVQTSSRRYEERGVIALQYHFGIIHLKYFLGAKPNELHQYYIRHIAV